MRTPPAMDAQRPRRVVCDAPRGCPSHPHHARTRTREGAFPCGKPTHPRRRARLSLLTEPTKWDSAEALTAAAEAEASSAQSASPKPGAGSGGQGTTTPQTGNMSSRVASTNFSSQRPPPAPMSQVPLVAVRAAPIDSLNPYSNKWIIKVSQSATRPRDGRCLSR